MIEPRRTPQRHPRSLGMVVLAVGILAIGGLALVIVGRSRDEAKTPQVEKANEKRKIASHQDKPSKQPKNGPSPEGIPASEDRSRDEDLPRPAAVSNPEPSPTSVPQIKKPTEKTLELPVLQKEVAFKDVGPFIVSLGRDLDGNIWVGTEDNGIFRHNPKNEVDPTSGTWTQFTGYGDDNAYAIACDSLGRVWVGTLNHGVSVFNGEKWQNYDILDGPIGERIFAIACCPTDGDVWMATSAGLSRYSQKKDRWEHITLADGLPENQATSLAFDANGTLYAGMQCKGIAIAAASENYKRWSLHPAPSVLPVTALGKGLPSGLINSVLVARNGTVYAATTAGLAWSQDRGTTWSHMRGRDYAAKIKSRRGGPPPGWIEASKETLDSLLPDDYVTCLAEDDSGLIWLGFRQQGLIGIDPKTQRRVVHVKSKPDGLPNEYVSTIMTSSGTQPLIGTYGGGLAAVKRPLPKGSPPKPPLARKSSAQKVPFPSKIGPPSLDELTALAIYLRKPDGGTSRPDNLVRVLDDDWKTQGDFYGKDEYRDFRYGEYVAHLCAFASPFDSEWGRDGMRFFAWAETGSNAMKGEALRHWVHFARTTNRRCLKNPFETERCQSEWDDHKEAYPLSHDGPHIYITVKTPPGAYYVSLYFHNKDGHDDANRLRDYLITVKTLCETDAEFDKAPVLARARVNHFWGGVYKRFLVSGKGKYTFELNANWSFNTIISAVCFDPLTDEEKYVLRCVDVPRVQFRFTGEETKQLNDLEDKKTTYSKTFSCFAKLESLRHKEPVRFAILSRRASLTILRGLEAEWEKEGRDKQAERAKAACCHYLHLFDQRDNGYSLLKE